MVGKLYIGHSDPMIPPGICGVPFHGMWAGHGGLILINTIWKTNKMLLPKVGYKKIATYWVGREEEREERQVSHLIQSEARCCVLTWPVGRHRWQGSGASSQ